MVPIASGFTRARKALSQGLGEARLHAKAAGAGQGRPSVVFLPSAGREGAALLRIWNQAQTLQTLGWRTAVIPPALSLGARHRCLATLAPDIVVMQGARHPLNRPEFYPGRRIVYDMDDADFHLPHLADHVRRAMTQVTGIVAGSRYVAYWACDHGARRATVIWTGAEVSMRPRTPQASRPPVIAWAQSRPQDYPHEAAFVARVMVGLGRAHPGVTLRLFDRSARSDPAFSRRFETSGVRVEWANTALYSDYLTLLDDVAIGLAPIMGADPFGRGKSFGKVLAYLDRHVPVIASDANDHGLFFTPETGVITNDEGAWIAGISRLLDDAPARQAIAEAGFAAFRARLSSETAALRLSGFLGEMLAAGRSCDASLRQAPGQGAELLRP